MANDVHIALYEDIMCMGRVAMIARGEVFCRNEMPYREYDYRALDDPDTSLGREVGALGMRVYLRSLDGATIAEFDEKVEHARQVLDYTLALTVPYTDTPAHAEDGRIKRETFKPLALAPSVEHVMNYGMRLRHPEGPPATDDPDETRAMLREGIIYVMDFIRVIKQPVRGWATLELQEAVAEVMKLNVIDSIDDPAALQPVGTEDVDPDVEEAERPSKRGRRP